MAKVKIGRPRSEKSQAAILNAVDALLKEKGGSALSIEAIAKRAKVGKPTLYRWWPSLADIVLEAAFRRADTSIPVPSSESLRDMLRLFLRQSMTAIVEGGGVYLRYLMAHAQQDDAFRARFREHFVANRREVLRSILQKGMDRDQMGSNHDLELLVDMVFGAMWYRLLTDHAPLDNSFAEGLTEVVMGILTAPDPKPADV